MYPTRLFHLFTFSLYNFAPSFIKIKRLKVKKVSFNCIQQNFFTFSLFHFFTLKLCTVFYQNQIAVKDGADDEKFFTVV